MAKPTKSHGNNGKAISISTREAVRHKSSVYNSPAAI